MSGRKGRLDLELLDEHPFGGDLAEACRSAEQDTRRWPPAGSPRAGEPDDPDVVTEVLPAELRADAELLSQLGTLASRSRSRKACAPIEPRVGASRGTGRGVLRGLEGELALVPPMTMARW